MTLESWVFEKNKTVLFENSSFQIYLNMSLQESAGI